jgi:hypothetical protein
MQHGSLPLHGFERDINSLIDAFALQVSKTRLQAALVMLWDACLPGHALPPHGGLLTVPAASAAVTVAAAAAAAG